MANGTIRKDKKINNALGELYDISQLNFLTYKKHLRSNKPTIK